MNLIELIFCGVITISTALLFVVMFRNDKVLNFRLKLIEQIYAYNTIVSKEKFIDLRIDYSVMGPYNRMIYMFWKPLKIEKWLSKETLNKLKNLK